MKVHVVEDEAALLKAIAMSLTKAGYTVTTSSDGSRAESEIFNAKPDVVIMDLLLPGKNGLEVIKDIRSKNYKGKIIVFTNYDPRDIKQSDIQNLKISDILVKSSVSLSDLINAIRATANK